MENSPAHSSKSNGVIERGVQTIQGMVRTLRSAIEERWMVKLDPENALWTWLVEYSGWLVNRAEVGHDGRTPYERLKGKKARLPGMEFGEAVMWKRRPTGQVFLPLERRHLLGSVGQHGRVHRGRWRRGVEDANSEGERWSKDTIKLVGGVPQDPNVDGEGMKLDVTVMDQQYRDQLRGQWEDLEKVPRNFYLKERDFESHGYIEGCPGCISLLKRGTRLAHSKGCRVRMEEVMKGDERLERANKRTNEHLAKVVKANVEKAEAEKKAKLDKDMEVDTGVGERHGASSSTEMATGSGTKRDIDTDDGDAMIDGNQ